MSRFALMSYNTEFGFWELNAVYDGEPEARAELKRIHGKASYKIRLFRMDEIMDARSPFFHLESTALPQSASP